MLTETLCIAALLTLLGSCATPQPAVSASSAEIRTDTLTMTLDCESNATLHGVTLIPPDTSRSVVLIERIEIERRARSETRAASTEQAAETGTQTPPAVARRKTVSDGAIWLMLTALVAGLIWIRKQ